MPQGTLEVLLVGAKGLENTDFLCKINPYVILKCRTQEQKSTIASGQGTEPEWNETFVFTVSKDTSELDIIIMDSDSFSADDFVGKATISLEPLFMAGRLAPTPYNVVNMDLEYKGEIKIGLAFFSDDFIPEENGDGGYAYFYPETYQNDGEENFEE